jgi:hypothetical protein
MGYIQLYPKITNKLRDDYLLSYSRACRNQQTPPMVFFLKHRNNLKPTRDEGRNVSKALAA